MNEYGIKGNNYLVVSHENLEQIRYTGFETEREAREFIDDEHLNHRRCHIYDCTNGIPAEFINEWCEQADKFADEIEAEREGYYRDDTVELWLLAQVWRRQF